jgi:hypothetical protein
MSLIRKLPQLAPEQAWWRRVQMVVKHYAKLVDRAPRAEDEAFDFWMQQVKELYTQIQRSSCPDEADVVYTSLTRSMINMTMCYEAQRQDDWAKVDIFYGRALEDWQASQHHLARIGILLSPTA